MRGTSLSGAITRFPEVHAEASGQIGAPPAVIRAVRSPVKSACARRAAEEPHSSSSASCTGYVADWSPDVAFANDPGAQRFVDDHPQAASLAMIGSAFGITSERVRQVEVQAMNRLVAQLALEGVNRTDVLEWLASKTEPVEVMDEAEPWD